MLKLVVGETTKQKRPYRLMEILYITRVTDKHYFFQPVFIINNGSLSLRM